MSIKRLLAKARHFKETQDEKRRQKLVLARNKAERETRNYNEMSRAKRELQEARDKRARAKAQFNKTKGEGAISKASKGIVKFLTTKSKKRKVKQTSKPRKTTNWAKLNDW